MLLLPSLLTLLPAFATAASISQLSPRTNNASESAPDLSAEPVDIIDLGYQKVQGYRSTTGYKVWKSIKYATAERFQAPVTPAYNETILDASVDSRQCWQNNGLTIGQPPVPIYGTEDCLTLNVWAPGNSSAGDALPVLVWIHGGGFQYGNGSRYDGERVMDVAEGKLILVTMQYRLGAFGFLAGSEIAEHGALNRGLLDQQFALKFVQKQIEQFGGSPTHVTIWGESAGAASVLHHTIAYGGDSQTALNLPYPLFSNVIASSGYLPTDYPAVSEQTETLYRNVALAAGCASNASAFENSFECLKMVDELVLAQAIQSTGNSFTPVVDGDFVQKSPTRLLQEGKVNARFITAFNNDNEGFSFTSSGLKLPANATQTPAQLASAFEASIASSYPYITHKDRAAIADLYPITNFPEANNTYERVKAVSSTRFLCGTLLLAEAFGDKGYKGRFAVPPAQHALDEGVYFNSTSPSTDALISQSFIDGFVGSIVSSALRYTPNHNPSPSVPHWPTYQTRMEMVFNVTEDASNELVATVVKTEESTPGLTERCAYWTGEVVERTFA